MTRRLWVPGRWAGGAAVAAMVCAAPEASAVSPAAEALFQEGRRLLAAGQVDVACSRFAESYAADASSGTLLNLALCHETQGKTATAWAEYRAAARLARNQGREDRAGAADEKIAALEPRLARLTLVPAKPVPGLKVTTKAGTLGEGGLGVAVPIDPGLHDVAVSAPGYRDWTGTVEVRDGEQRTLEVPELEAEPAPEGRAQSGGGAVVPVVGAENREPGERSRLDYYLAGGGGLLAIGGAAVWAVAYSRFQDAKNTCNGPDGCSDAERNSRISTIQTLKRVAAGSWIAGGTLVVAAGVHYIFTPKAAREGATVSVGIDPGGRGGGLAVHGVF